MPHDGNSDPHRLLIAKRAGPHSQSHDPSLSSMSLYNIARSKSKYGALRHNVPPGMCNPDEWTLIGGVLVLFMGATFGLFTCAMACDQVSAITSDQTLIEQLQVAYELYSTILSAHLPSQSNHLSCEQAVSSSTVSHV